jgi:hypothetical protein
MVQTKTDTSITWKWNISTGAGDYQIERGDGVTQYTNNNTTYTWSGLNPSTTYQLRVRACNTAHTACSSYSIFSSGTTNATPPPVPTNLRVTDVTRNSIRWDWNSSAGATYYSLNFYTNGTCSGTAQQLWTMGLYYNRIALLANTQYSATVKACKSFNADCSALSVCVPQRTNN